MLDSDSLDPLRKALCQETTRLNALVDSWLTKVFQGDSSGLALKSILESQSKTQQRLKLKWQQIQPQTARQRLNYFKRIKKTTTSEK